MVYLIESEGRNETYYKIGYAKDGSFEGRLDSYKLHNPFCKVLYTIPEATEDHEKLIQAKFNEYRVYRREWFKDSVKILRFFDRHRTKESLDNEFKVSDLSYFIRGADKKLTERYIDLRKEVEMLINIYCTERLKKDNSEEIAIECDTLMNKYIPMLGKTIFSIEMFKASFSEGDLSIIDVNLGDDIKKFLEDFETLPDFNRKMKALCDNDFSENEILAILNQIPITYKKYYIVLGPGRCKAHGYNVTNIRREYEDIKNGVVRVKVRKERKPKKKKEEVKIDKEALLNNIYSTFQIGGFYSNKDVKELLRNVYSSYGYKASPKASELDKYFKVVRARKSVEGKQIEGVRILEKL